MMGDRKRGRWLNCRVAPPHMPVNWVYCLPTAIVLIYRCGLLSGFVIASLNPDLIVGGGSLSWQRDFATVNEILALRDSSRFDGGGPVARNHSIELAGHDVRHDFRHDETPNPQ